MWELETKSWSSVKAANILNSQRISPAPSLALFVSLPSNSYVAKAQMQYAAKIGFEFLTQLLGAGVVAVCYLLG